MPGNNLPKPAMKNTLDEKKPDLRILHLEDDSNDAELISANLAEGGILCSITLVETREQFLFALEAREYDLILADFKLPSFDALSALEIVKEKHLEIPFILVSGTVGEELAVEALKTGVTDYVLKPRLSRLVPAVLRAMKESEERRELKQAEEALHAYDVEREQILKHTPFMFVHCTRDLRYRYVSLSYARLVGYRQEEIAGKKIAEILGDEAFQKARPYIEKVLQGEAVQYEIQITLQKGGSQFLSVGYVPEKDEQGEVLGFIGSMVDISDTKRLQNQLQEFMERYHELLRIDRSSRLGELTASLSHELNQPLGAILSNAQAALRFLASGKNDPELFREILQNIVHDSKRGADIIRSLRSLVKKGETKKEPININEVLREIVDILNSEVIAHNMTISPLLDETLPLVIADKTQIQQVTLNLIMNAIDAMSQSAADNKKIKLQTETNNGFVRVSVYDSGPGIPSEDVDRVFDPFYTTKIGGLGMGLAVCKSIIKGHGGRISASNNPEGGAIFSFDLNIQGHI